MNSMIKKIFVSASGKLLEVSRLLLRVGLGVSFIFHGYPKIAGGVHMWYLIGLKIKSIGVTILATTFGFAASCSEFVGGIFLIIGFLIRPSAFVLTISMIVALFFLLSKQAEFDDYSHPLELIFVFLFLLVTGADRFSVDYIINRRFR
jgi:putative oxidoreductase